VAAGDLVYRAAGACQLAGTQRVPREKGDPLAFAGLDTASEERSLRFIAVLNRNDGHYV
jgi:hypothetical protein